MMNVIEENCFRIRPLSAHFTSSGRLAGTGKGANQLAASLTLISLRSHQSFPHSFEATRDARATARNNQVTVGIEDFKRNCIGERVPIDSDLDNARQSVCLRPGASGAKNEGLGHRAVTVPSVCRQTPRLGVLNEGSWPAVV